jgi:hypothetical protein
LSAKTAYESNRQKWSDIQDHLPRLYAAAKGHCLEIGVRSGMSTSALLAGIEEKGGHLWSIDVEDCRVFDGHPQWTFLQGNSLLREIETALPDIQFEVVFIDGDHSYEGALIDLFLHGARGKKVFVHDTDAPDYPGVRAAVDFYCGQAHRGVEFHSGSFGMAEIS